MKNKGGWIGERKGGDKDKMKDERKEGTDPEKLVLLG